MSHKLFQTIFCKVYSGLLHLLHALQMRFVILLHLMSNGINIVYWVLVVLKCKFSFILNFNCLVTDTLNLLYAHFGPFKCKHALFYFDFVLQSLFFEVKVMIFCRLYFSNSLLILRPNELCTVLDFKAVRLKMFCKSLNRFYKITCDLLDLLFEYLGKLIDALFYTF